MACQASTRAGLLDVVPQHGVAAEVVLDRLEHLRAAVDHLGGHVAEFLDDRVGIEGGIAGPAGEAAGRLVREVERRGQQDQVLQPVIGSQRRVHRADQGTQAPAEHAELVRPGDFLELANGARQILQRVVVEREVLVFRARRTPIEQIQIVAVSEHVFGIAVTRAQVEHMGPVHDREDHQQRNRLALLLRHDGNEAVQLGLVQRPDQLLGRLRDLRIGRQQPVELVDVLGRFVPAGTEVEKGRNLRCWRRGLDVASLMVSCLRCARTRACSSSFASRSSSRISILVRRSAIRVTSSRVGKLSCASVLAMLSSIALRNGPEVVSQASSIAPVDSA